MASARKLTEVYVYKRDLLVAFLKAEPGRILPTISTDAASTLECPYASGQCFSVTWEPDVFKGVGECQTFAELLKRMRFYKYRLEEKEPNYKRRHYHRL